ncbi:hypothetical protein GGD83_004241 [Rhodoblastus sphagnicola]|nr:hypothetical protein [Rhodoblastus sphagnicola]
MYSLQKYCTRDDIEIILVDNGQDGSGERAAANYPKVKVLPPIGNVGFGAGNNYAFRHSKGEYILLLNPDTEICDNSILVLLNFLKQVSGDVIVGGRTTFNDRLDNGNQLRLPSIAVLFKEMLGASKTHLKIAKRPGQTEPYRVEVVSGAFLMTRRTTWKKLGGFDEGFFLYFEEVDLCKRLAAVGGAAWVKPDCMVRHDVGSGEKVGETRIMLQLAGEMHYIRKHFPRGRAAVAFVFVYLTVLRRFLKYALLSAVDRGCHAGRRAFAKALTNPSAWRFGYALKERD